MKITPVLFAINPQGFPYVIDDEGRMWVYISGEWKLEAWLPDEPA
jgi:hypothetical protein